MAVGIFARAWFLAHVPISSDAAVAGLIAGNILHGHFQAFYWGQNYGGVEPYLIAFVFAAFGRSAFSLGLTPVLLTAGSAVVIWRIGRRLVRDPILAVLAGAIVWAAPAVGVENSTIEFGFRRRDAFLRVSRFTAGAADLGRVEKVDGPCRVRCSRRRQLVGFT